ncbi:hypothetical protein TSUD_206150 [Trifolium subterraneum]|uniref:DDE Tnp4 domain-containing protein n=1 Tax=Trifolium subterraneum TaxID=3900 RepID=A0A2Z6MKR0_TRISU|nr:hypothetical protein TSUD_206150 [Trifolium subterraneum]
MDITSISLEDYSFLFPEMDQQQQQPNINSTKKRNYPEEQSQQTHWYTNNNNSFNSLNDTTALNDILTSLIQFDKQQLTPKQEQQSQQPTPMNSNPNSNEFQLDFEVEDSSSPAKKPRLTDTTATSGPSRRLWVKDRSKDWWQWCNSPECPEEEFRRFFRMSKATFEFICNELDSAVMKKNTMLRDAIPVRQRVAVCIWRLATGDALRIVSKRFGLGISTCHKLVLENLTWTQHAFNEKVGDIQKLCKDAFAKVKGRWSCLQKRTEVKIEDLPGVLVSLVGTRQQLWVIS